MCSAGPSNRRNAKPWIPFEGWSGEGRVSMRVIVTGCFCRRRFGGV
jgi:hypothetical protein